MEQQYCMSSSTHNHLMMWMNNSKNIHQKLFPLSPMNSLSSSSSSSSSAAAAAGFEEEPAFRRFAWPPRSYSCSFCRREFRSAQALGGHMNVHRRDRARLNHQPSPPPPPPPQSQAAAAGETAGTLHHHHHQKHAFYNSYKKRADGEKPVEKRDSSSAGIIGLVDGTAAGVCKRNKKSPLMAAPPPLFYHSKVLVSSSTHEIDLELRLGLGFHIHG
ncbi:hypothetical protein ACP275_06G074900 [Erythranthe tilingii]